MALVFWVKLVFGEVKSECFSFLICHFEYREKSILAFS